MFSSVDPSLATEKMRQIFLKQAAVGIIYMITGGLLYAFSGSATESFCK
jgi:hypothetical protein